MKKILLMGLIVFFPCMIISSGKKRIYNFPDETRAVFKAAREQKFKETGNQDEAQRAYNRAYYAGCRQVDKQRVIATVHSPMTIIQITPTHAMEAQTTELKYFEKNIVKKVAAIAQKKKIRTSAFQSVPALRVKNMSVQAEPVQTVPVIIPSNNLVSYISDLDCRHISNLTESELHTKTEAMLKRNDWSQARYLEVSRSILEYSILELAPEEKACNQRIFDEVLLPEYIETIHDQNQTDVPMKQYCWWTDDFGYENPKPIVRRRKINALMNLQKTSAPQEVDQWNQDLLTCSDLSFELKCDEN